MVQWKPIEKSPHKKLKLNTINAVGVKAYPVIVMPKILLVQSYISSRVGYCFLFRRISE